MASTGKVDTPQGTARLEAFGNRVLRQAAPSRKLLLGQLEDVLSGGNGSRIPIIGRAVAANQQATANALRGTQDSLKVSGLDGSIFGNRIASRVQRTGAVQGSQIPARIMAPMVANAPRLIAQFQGQGLEALSGATGLRLRQEMFNDDQSRKFFQDLKSSFQTTGG